MTFLQNLWRDLVDKKLWPVAIALVVAAVAVPVLIGSGSSDDDVAAVAPAPVETAKLPGAADVSIATPDTTKQRARSGSARDPFKALVFAKTPKGTAVATTGTAAKSSGSASSAAAAVTPAPAVKDTTPAPSAPAATPSSSTTTTTKLFQYAVTLTTKRDGKSTTRKAVRPISYVPSAAYPLLTFLGMKDQGKTATFLVRDDVTVSGADRVCRPSRANCQFLELQTGDDVLIAKIPPAGQKTRHFRLMIGKVSLAAIAKPSQAEARSRAFRNLPPVASSRVEAVTTTQTTTG